MEHFFVALFQGHSDTMRHWGVLILFLVSFLESLPILGAFLPGQTIIIFGGFLVKLGFFGFIPALLATIIGAMLGDLSGFLLGKFYGPALSHKKIWKLEKKHFDATTEMLEKNSVKSIFIGRIHSFTRSLMPFAAGMSKISVKKFTIIDVLTIIVWATLCISIGFIFGKSFELASAFIGKFAIISTMIAIVIFAAVAHVKNKDQKNISSAAVLAGISVTFLYLFVIIGAHFNTSRLLHILDIKMSFLSLSIQSPWLTDIMIIITSIGEPVVVAIVGVLLTIILVSKKRILDANIVFWTLGGGGVLISLLKAIFQRARPGNGLIAETGYSFPSGHAMMAAIAVILLYYIQIRKIKDEKIRDFWTAVAIVGAFIIGISRIYLRVHFASDVIGGFCAGIAFGTLAIVAFQLLMFIIKKSRREKSLPDIP